MGGSSLYFDIIKDYGVNTFYIPWAGGGGGGRVVLVHLLLIRREGMLTS